MPTEADCPERSPSDEESAAFLRGLRDGDPQTLHRFVEAYRPALERVASRELSVTLQTRVSPESIAQSVCRTFLRRASDGQFEIPNERALFGLLSAIAVKKVRTHVRFHTRQRRDLRRDTPLGGQGEVPTLTVPGPSHLEAFERCLATAITSLDE